uniref:WD_REPEATS_REGION domain-containing protein n=1 Tax=Steinernema glaseri TaxID=37863 RepID=A0A1I7YMQ4_9BILA
MGLGESRPSSDEAPSPSSDAPEDVLNVAANIVAQERAFAAAFPNQRIRSGRPGRSQIASILRDLLENQAIDVASNIDDLREALSFPRATNHSELSARDESTSSEFEADMSYYYGGQAEDENNRKKSYRQVTKCRELRKSYEHIRHDLESRNGAIYFRDDRYNTVHRGFLPDMLFRRELSLDRPNFSLGQQASISNSFIPNTRRVVASVKSKTFCLQYAEQGNTIITASQDANFRLYRRSAHDRYKQFGHTRVPAIGWSILDFGVSADSRHIIYSTWDTNLYQCTLNSDGNFSTNPEWTPLHLLEADRFAAFSMKLNSDDTEIVVGGSEGNLIIYNRELNKTVFRVKGHEDDTNAVSFADSSSHLILSAGDDGLCKVWDRRILADSTHTPAPVGVFAGHKDGITFIDARGDDRYVLTNSKDQSIKLWDLRHFSSSAAEKATKLAVAHQSWDYRWQHPESDMQPPPLEGDSSIMTFYGAHSVMHTLIRARFSPDHTGKRFIYTGCARGNVTVYDMYTGRLCTTLIGHKSVVRDIRWHPQNNEVLTASWDGQTALWKFDERAVRDINPDSIIDEVGGEDSCDELYRPLTKKSRRKRKFESPRFDSFHLERSSIDDDCENQPHPTRRYNLRHSSQGPSTSGQSSSQTRPGDVSGVYHQALQRRKRGPPRDDEEEDEEDLYEDYDCDY